MPSRDLAPFALATLLFCASASAAPFPVPVRHAAEPAAFAPEGWSIELSIEADLNGDADSDQVLVLLRNPVEGSDRARALVVLLKKGNGFDAVGTNRTILACFECLGQKGGEGTPEITVKNRVIAVTQWGGSRYSYDSTYKLRWSGAAGRIQLIGLDTGSSDSVLGSSTETSTNFLTGDVVTVEQPAQVDDAGNATNAPARTKRKKLPKRPLVALERLEPRY
jgi:hypothetical protein